MIGLTSIPTIKPQVLADMVAQGLVEVEYASEIPGALTLINHARTPLALVDEAGQRHFLAPGNRMLASSPNLSKRLIHGIGSTERSRWERLRDPQEEILIDLGG